MNNASIDKFISTNSYTDELNDFFSFNHKPSFFSTALTNEKAQTPKGKAACRVCVLLSTVAGFLCVSSSLRLFCSLIVVLCVLIRFCSRFNPGRFGWRRANRNGIHLHPIPLSICSLAILTALSPSLIDTRRFRSTSPPLAVLSLSPFLSPTLLSSSTCRICEMCSINSRALPCSETTVAAHPAADQVRQTDKRGSGGRVPKPGAQDRAIEIAIGLSTDHQTPATPPDPLVSPHRMTHLFCLSSLLFPPSPRRSPYQS